ncbi:MAG TPA: TerC family protein [bacterium]|nr:TerC family protein [bacterium]
MSWMGSGSPFHWGVFVAAVVIALAIDLGVFRGRDTPIGTRTALGWTAFWIAFATGFAAFVWHQLAGEKAALFGTGYVIEYALSVDNLFVFIIVFRYFKVPPTVQRRVLFWGIVSAALLRGILIFVGAALIAAFHWVLYLFGAFLLYTAFTLLFSEEGEESVDPGKNPVLRALRRFVPLSEDYDGARFFTVRDGKLLATPLLAVLLVVETTDVFFALDSVPAIFAVSTDPFIVYTSNIFAILGLRSLYFALAALMGKFRYLNLGVASVLVFVSVKMLAAAFVEVPTPISLAIVFAILAASVTASVLHPEPPETLERTEEALPETNGAGGDSGKGTGQ